MICVSEVYCEIGGYAIDIKSSADSPRPITLVFNSQKNAEIIKRVIEVDNNECRDANVEYIEKGKWLDVSEDAASRLYETCSVCGTRTGFVGPRFCISDNHCPCCGAILRDNGN